jgi:mono/diheme cytochrome c family protein
MRIHRQLLLAAFLLVCALGAGAQDKEIKRAPVRPTSAASGKEMFVSYCAVCHGRNGKGGGRLPRH